MKYSSWKGQNLLFWRVLKKAWFKPFCSLYLRKKEEIEKSPRWRHLYEHKHLIDTVFDLISLTVWAVGGTAIDLGNFSRLLSLYFHAVCSFLPSVFSLTKYFRLNPLCSVTSFSLLLLVLLLLLLALASVSFAVGSESAGASSLRRSSASVFCRRKQHKYRF